MAHGLVPGWLPRQLRERGRRGTGVRVPHLLRRHHTTPSAHTRRPARTCADFLNRSDGLTAPAHAGTRGRVFARSMADMSAGRASRHGRAGPLIAVLLLVALVPCFVHVDSSGPEDLCLSFGPPAAPGAVPELLPAGHSAPPLKAVYRDVPADLPVPPPRA